MSDMISVCKVRTIMDLSCRGCEYYGKSCNNYKSKYGHNPYVFKRAKENNKMAIRTGKFSMKALMEGKVKVAKDDLVGKRSHVVDIIKGSSEDNGDYVYLFLEDLKYVSVPSANLEEFYDYANTPEDADAIRSGAYDVIFEKATSKKGREYFTCYLDEHQA